MLTDELKKQTRAIDLAALAGRKRQSPRTGLVHLFSGEDAPDTIPVYENFCFAFALFRQKTTESVTEAKAIIERLLTFRVNGNFPVYLHEFPKCFDHHLGLKIAPVLIYLVRLFSPVLGELKQKIEKALQEILAQRPEKLFWENRYRACVGESLLGQDTTAFSPLDWTDWIITAQLSGQTHFFLPYDDQLQMFFGAVDIQEKDQPRPNPIEWLLAEPNFSPRLLKDHPHQILTAPLFPFTFTKSELPSATFRMFWQGSNSLHSLVAKSLEFDLETEADTTRNNLFEASIYCNASNETEIFVEGKKATAFQLGETITISTPQKSISFHFELVSGSGDFFGHIFKANRWSQVSCKGVNSYEAYDWQIGLRTLRRSEKAKIRIVLTKVLDVR
jgi:hypothetical protein